MENGTLTQGEGKDPSGFLSEIIGNPVICQAQLWRRLHRVSIDDLLVLVRVVRFEFAPADPHTGELQSVDGYMNIALEKTEEYVDGVKKRSYGDAFVRGNNGESRTLRPYFYACPCL